MERRDKKPRRLLAGIPEHVVATMRPELREDPDDLLLELDRGHENYVRALHCLMVRFQNSRFCKPDLMTGKPRRAPDQMIADSVHSLIARFFGNDKIFPMSPEGRPLGVPEIAVLMGAVIATAAAQAYEDNLATLEEIDAQIETAWVALHDWLPRGVLVIREARRKGVIPQVAR